MARFTLATVATLLAIAQSSFAQDDRALTDLNRNRPTKTWTQWQPKATYAFEELPDQYMGSNRIPAGEGGTPGGEPQSGYNTCARDTWNQDSKCQTAWINSLEDWCLFAPAEYGTVGAMERHGVAYCTTDKHGTRLIPDGTIRGAHFVRTRDYVQVTGVGDFTTMNVPAGDDGGEFDPHGADDLGNPIGGILYTTANPATNGQPQFISEWNSFLSDDQFCLRACWGQNAARQCEHIYDVLGCNWNHPANYEPNVFESCDGDIGQLQGVYGGSTFRQGDPVTPPAHPAPPSSNCQTTSSLAHGLLGRDAAVRPTDSASSGSASSASSTASSSGASASAAAGSTSTRAGGASSAAPTGNANANANANANTASTSGQNTAAQNSGASSLQLPLVSGMAVGFVALALFL